MMRIQTKKQARLSASKGIVAIVALILFFISCEKKDYVKVAGKVFDESVLKKENPEVYQGIRREYEEKIMDAVTKMSEDYLLTLMAKENNLENEDQYTEFIRSNLKEPTDQETQAYYNNYKINNPQQELPPYVEVAGEIKRIISNDRLQDKLGENLRIARQKYKYEVVIEKEPEVLTVNTEGAPFRGNPDAKIEIVEFSGFECPYCQRVQKTTAKLRNKIYPNKIRWVFKDYPLQTNSIAAHLASRCVYQQDQNLFWQFYDALFSQSGREHLKMDALKEQVAQIKGIDQKKFAACLEDPAITKGILDSHQTGINLGVNGIPAFFINGRLLSGAQPIEVFEQMIEAELNK